MKKVNPFKPKTKAERQLVSLIKTAVAQISGDGFSEWHRWKQIRSNEPCPNSSPFIPFLKEWLQEDKKNRLPILLAGIQAYFKSLDPYMKVEIHRKPKPKPKP
jgi:hypothetical protein